MCFGQLVRSETVLLPVPSLKAEVHNLEHVNTKSAKSDLLKWQSGSYNTGFKYHYVAALCKGRPVLGKMILSFPYTH
jgi:hypothetical protein